VRAPDAIEPAVGWRVWDVVRTGDELRLRSPSFPLSWPAGEPVKASCRRSPENPSYGAVSLHATPDRACSCGVYGAAAVEDAIGQLSPRYPVRPGALHRVIGRVSLWGRVLECEDGWRASLAYPAALYVPVPRPARLRLHGPVFAPLVSPADVAAALADYRVPVELVDCSGRGDLLAALGGRRPRLPDGIRLPHVGVPRLSSRRPRPL
jgi:hypothetical protein